MKALLTTLVVLTTPAFAGPLVPSGWDAALAGDLVMEKLITVTAPQVKGAHDAEMVIVADKAYLVAEVNDVRAGESAGWPEIYATLSIVRLNPVQLETVIPIARGEQVFDNETLPVGACFVPRILQKDAKALRCYFTSEDPGKRQSQLWYRDFELESGAFAPTIHRAKLKTAAGTFDFQPQFFHADAAARGFAKPAVDSSFFLFDSFKRFDGKLHVAINNFTGKQNALALVHEDLATFEILGHYNEPQSQQLSESAVNRLPDGAWMAICRNDAGNYHFTTSTDGRNWTEGCEMPFVQNGANSKPTFDRFGDLFYLGWQEKATIHGVSRSVFNVEISRDGKNWERKYRFESVKSFQYPTFREHEGVIWLCATQGDTSASRKERIVFGKLETLGEFSDQRGKTRQPVPPPPAGKAELTTGVKLFADRDDTLEAAPRAVMGEPFLRTTIERTAVRVTKPGLPRAPAPAMAASHHRSHGRRCNPVPSLMQPCLISDVTLLDRPQGRTGAGLRPRRRGKTPENTHTKIITAIDANVRKAPTTKLSILQYMMNHRPVLESEFPTLMRRYESSPESRKRRPKKAADRFSVAPIPAVYTLRDCFTPTPP